MPKGTPASGLHLRGRGKTLIADELGMRTGWGSSVGDLRPCPLIMLNNNQNALVFIPVWGKMFTTDI